MSRSMWAWWKHRIPAGATSGGEPETAKHNRRANLNVRPRAGTAASPTRFVKLIAAGACAVAAVPAPALAANTSSNAARADTPKHSVATPRPGNEVLANGSGYGSRAEAARVRALQRQLSLAGFSPGPVDGRYGPETEQAVGAFQAARDLRVDGIAGPLTLAALTRADSVIAPGAGYAGPGGAAVRTLQRRLARSGFSPGPIDGRYGPRTEHAVARFQAAHRLQADGIVGPRTSAALGSSLGTAHRSERGKAHAGRGTSNAKPTSPVPPHPSHPAKPPATHTAAPAGHPAGSSSVGPLALLLALLLGLAGAMALATIWLSRRKHAEPANEPAARATATHQPEPVAAAGSTQVAGDRPQADSPEQPRRQVNAERLFALGAELEQRGERDHARQAYERADQLGHGPAACNLGVLLDQDGQRGEAEAVFRRAAQRGDGSGAFNLGALLEEGGDLDGALAAYQHAERIGNEDVAAMARQARRELQGQLGRLSVARKGGVGNGG